MASLSREGDQIRYSYQVGVNPTEGETRVHEGQISETRALEILRMLEVVTKGKMPTAADLDKIVMTPMEREAIEWLHKLGEGLAKGQLLGKLDEDFQRTDLASRPSSDRDYSTDANIIFGLFAAAKDK